MWKEIVSADDCEVAYELMDWCGVRDAWDRNDLEAYYNFFNDVAEDCDHMIIKKKSWDANMPGLSGVWHIIKTDDPKALKKELRSRLAKLIWESRKMIRDYHRIRAEEEKRAEQEKKDREWEQHLKELENGPADGILICTLGIWDDITSYSEEYCFELSQEDPQCLKVWGKVNKTWTSCRVWSTKFDGDMK
ncbi:MAG: hypothetical protein AB7C92_08215, partial [Synergistaceae bacterium]